MISTGEPSGDLHGASLIKAFKEIHPQTKFFGLGGDQVAAAGAELRYHLNDTAVMGLVEVFASLGRILKALNGLKKALRTEKPDALILIDLPDFNFRLAKAAYKAGVPVIYYICPQVWAWRKGRIKTLAKYTKQRLLIFPFEADFYRKNGLEAIFVGHPLLDRMQALPTKNEAKALLNIPENEKLLLLMPGSRKAEIKFLTPHMLKAADLLLEKNPNLSLALAQADSVDLNLLKHYLKESSKKVQDKLKFFKNSSHLLLKAAEATILASGTATLEAAMCRTPMVVSYKMNALTWFLAKRFVDVPHVSMVNLIAQKTLVPEVLQGDLDGETLAKYAWLLLNDSFERKEMLKGFDNIIESLGSSGASFRAAKIISEVISQN